MLRTSNFLITRCVQRPMIIQTMGKKKKNYLKPLEGAEAKYVNTQLIKDVNEPGYLQYLKPPIPFYYLLNIKLKCPDYAILEEFTRYSQKFFSGLSINVHDYWPLPHQSFRYDILRPGENAVDSQIDICVYERVIQLKDVKAVSIPIIIQILEASKPPGLTFSIIKHEESETRIRWVTDTSLLDLKKQLGEIYDELEELGVFGIRKPELLET